MSHANTKPSYSRADKKKLSRAKILAAAKQVFADNGYAKATIRLVAAHAECDPALVMHHFGSKQALFRSAIEMDLDIRRAFDGPDLGRTERVLRHFFETMDRNPQSIASTLRSMLTHDDVADDALALFNPPLPPGPTADGLPDASALLRRDLLIALTLGTAITRYVLKSAAIENAELPDLLRAMLPAAQLLDDARTDEHAASTA